MREALVEEGTELRARVASAGTMFLGGQRTSPIPRVLWSATPSAAPHLASWQSENPGFQVEEMSESDMDRFMAAETDQRTYRVFRTLPLPAMKFKIGGVYAGAGALKPVRDWFQPSSWMQGMGCKAVLGLDSPKTGYVVHTAFAAAPGQPVFKQALDLAVERVEADKGVDEAKRGRHFAAYYTGGGVFTDALKATTGVRESACRSDPDGKADDGSDGRVLHSCLYNAAVDELRRQNLCLEDEGFYSKDAASVDVGASGELEFHALWDGHESWDSLPKQVPPPASAPNSSIADMLAFMSDMDKADE